MGELEDVVRKLAAHVGWTGVVANYILPIANALQTGIDARPIQSLNDFEHDFNGIPADYKRSLNKTVFLTDYAYAVNKNIKNMSFKEGSEHIRALTLAFLRRVHAEYFIKHEGHFNVVVQGWPKDKRGIISSAYRRAGYSITILTKHLKMPEKHSFLEQAAEYFRRTIASNSYFKIVEPVPHALLAETYMLLRDDNHNGKRLLADAVDQYDKFLKLLPISVGGYRGAHIKPEHLISAAHCYKIAGTKGPAEDHLRNVIELLEKAVFMYQSEKIDGGAVGAANH